MTFNEHVAKEPTRFVVRRCLLKTLNHVSFLSLAESPSDTSPRPYLEQLSPPPLHPYQPTHTQGETCSSKLSIKMYPYQNKFWPLKGFKKSNGVPKWRQI